MFRFEEIRWANGDSWWILLVPLVLIPLWFAFEAYRRRIERGFPGAGLLPGLIEWAGGARRIAVWVSVFLALEMLALAAMRPQYGLKEVSIRGLGVDIAIVLDASRSMKAADMVPDRFTAAEIEIGRFLDRASGNRVALVPYAGIAFIQTPLTLDTGVIREYLRSLRVNDLPVPGTAIGRALNVAKSALGLVDEATTRGSIHKAMLLFTDGENHEGEPLEVADQLAKSGVRIFAVGVGTPAGQPIPILDEKGSVVGTARESDGVTPVLSKLDETLLKDLAARTGGRYFSLTGGADVATDLVNEIQALEKAEYRAQVDRLLEDRFQIPLAAGLFLVALSFLLLGIRPGTGRATAVGMLLLVATLTASSSTARSLPERDHPGVSSALRLLRDGHAGDAAKALDDLAQEFPNRPDLLYNLAIARDKAGDSDGAIDAVDKALAALARSSEAGRKFPPGEARLLHAKGTFLARKARRASDENRDPREVRTVWRQAVESLAGALIKDPESPDTRRNLELAAISAFPPCASLDDRHEPNGTAAEARFLTPDPNTLEAREDLLLCPRDTDWFRLPLQEGETLFASVLEPSSPKESDEAPPPGKAPAPKPAAVDLVLSGPDEVALEGPGKQLRLRAARMTSVFLKVTGPDEEDGIPYVLEARLVPPCPRGDDGMEPNNVRESAQAVTDGDHGLRICPGDEDWFTYTLQQGEQREIVLRPAAEEPPLELEVWSADGATVDVARNMGDDGVSLSARLPKAEQEAPFTIRVWGDNGDSFYQLSIRKPDGNDDQDSQDPDEKQDPEQDDPGEQPKPETGSQTMRELLDAIDRNEDNLEAQEAARQSPYRDWVPEKDW